MYMYCSKCGKENKKENSFCTQCGNKLLADETNNNELESENKLRTNTLRKKNRIYNKRKIVIIIITLIIIISFVCGMVYANNPIISFKNQVENNNSKEANKIFANKIKGNKKNEKKVIDILDSNFKKIENLFENEKITYDEAEKRMEVIKSINNTNNIGVNSNIPVAKISKLNNSRQSFKRGEEFIKKSDIENGIKEYKNVIKDDKNYAKAQEEIKKYIGQYKQDSLKRCEEYLNQENYNEAIKILTEANEIIGNDPELNEKINSYKKIEEEKVKETSKQNQELSVINCSVVPDYFKIEDEAKVIFKNNTNKVVKNFTVGILMYDANGYPLNSGVLAGEKQLFKGKAELVNIQPGGEYGYNSSWNLRTNYGTIKTVIACVRDVEYYDGSKWNNDYYTYWEKENLGKQLQ